MNKTNGVQHTLNLTSLILKIKGLLGLIELMASGLGSLGTPMEKYNIKIPIRNMIYTTSSIHTIHYVHRIGNGAVNLRLNLLFFSPIVCSTHQKFTYTD